MKTNRKEYLKQWRLRNKEKCRAYVKKYYEKNKEFCISRQRQYQLKYSYGITEDEYQKLLTKQEGRCAICKTDRATGRWKVFAVDHCHKTNIIRGLLCNECNRGMGLLGDSVERLQAAIKYLQQDQERE